MIDQVESYIENHPEVAVIDPLDNVRKLLDRYISYRVIHDSNLEDIGELCSKYKITYIHPLDEGSKISFTM